MKLRPPARDHELVQIVDAALADAARRAGKWLVCRPGCTQCCVGAFSINALDAERLRAGMASLRNSDLDRARRIKQRARDYLHRVSGQFPGDPVTGIIDENEEDEFEDFANDEVCPALDVETGTCDLYQFRPMTCRVFGPPIRDESRHLGICELCFRGASNQQIAACEMKPDPDGLEDKLLADLTGDEKPTQTIVAFVLAE
jgi:Fe-S-cluster containining protein